VKILKEKRKLIIIFLQKRIYSRIGFLVKTFAQNFVHLDDETNYLREKYKIKEKNIK